MGYSVVSPDELEWVTRPAEARDAERPKAPTWRRRPRPWRLRRRGRMLPPE